MKTIVLYATKHGAAAEIAARIATELDDAGTFDLKQEGIPALSDFDCVIVGSSIYAGAFRKEAKSFLAENADVLCEKKLGLFISGMGEDGAEAFKANVPDEVLKTAKVADVLGGVFDPAKAGFFERFIMRIVTKKSGFVSTISDDKINEFASAMKV